MKLNLSWFLFYGRMLGMGRQEILSTRWGEMMDMIACLSIYNGAEPEEKKQYSFEDVMKLR